MASNEMRPGWARQTSWPAARRVAALLFLSAGFLAGAGVALWLTRAQRQAAPSAAAVAGDSAGARGDPGGAGGASGGVTAGGPGGDAAGVPAGVAGVAGTLGAVGSGLPHADGYAGIAKAVMPAVVNVSSLQVIRTYERYSPFLSDPFFQQFFGGGMYDYVVPRDRRELSLGSGVFVDDDGTILTNNHVIEHATEVKVALSDDRELPARIIGVDPRTDLAVLRVEGSGLPKAVLGDSDNLQVGDVVLAFGNPFGLGGTVTMGIVSAIGRGDIGVADYEDFIQTDAAINPGNSGGALVNTRGEVVGINTAILSRSGGYQGVGFAIPSNMAREVLDSLVKHGRVLRGYAGLGLQRLTPELARAFGLSEPRGAVVNALDPNGPAADAGLQRGDVILSLGDKPVASVEELRTRMSRLKPGERATLGVARDGRRLKVEVTLGEPPRERQPRRRG
jgi:Do/DeqQ family serine protease